MFSALRHFGHLGQTYGDPDENVPGWVLANYFAKSFPVDFALEFENSRYWSAWTGECVLANLMATSRGSTQNAVNSSGIWASISSNLPALGSGLGLQSYVSRTNSIRNNSMQGAAGGTPGTLPTNWDFDAGNVTRTIVGTGTVNGIDYVDIRFQATANSDGNYKCSFEQSTQIAATQNQVWANSIFLAVVAGSVANMTIIAPQIIERNSGGTNLTVDIGTDIKASLTSTLQRFSLVQTLGQVTAAFAQPGVRLGFGSNQTIDITVRIGWPQLELGASVSPPIRTTNAAVTRNADVNSLIGVPSIAAVQSLYLKGTPASPVAYGSDQFGMAISDGTTSNRFGISRILTTGRPNWTLDTTKTQISASAWAINTSGKVAVANAAGDQAGSFNGGTAATSSDATSPTGLNRIEIGANGAGALQFNGTIAAVAGSISKRNANSGLVSVST